MKSRIPVTISMKIYANQAPATSFVYAFVVVNGGERSVRLNGLSPLFKCPYMFLCLLLDCLQCTHLFESMLMFMLE